MSNPDLWQSAPRAHALEREFGGRDPWWYFVHDGPRYIAEARGMAEQANHYNDFNVGAIVLAASNEGDIATFTGANQKLVPGETDSKICAELVALEKMLRTQEAINSQRGEEAAKKLFQVIGIFVSGPQQPDTQSGVETPTLHSCGIDRGIMWNEPSVRHDTLIVSIHPDEDLYEIYEHEVLQTMHALPGEVPPKAHRDPGFATWKNSLPAYERNVAKYKEGGIKEIPYARLATWAVTGLFKTRSQPRE
jgi:hypothetical protein